MLIGKKVHTLPSCHSTNDYLKEMIMKSEVFNGEVVITNSQTYGKGQRGNKWESDDNQNLTFSFYLTPENLSATEQFSLNYFVTLSLFSFLKDVLTESSKLSIKWPNDIYVGNHKIAGVLIENQVVASHLISSVVGVGLNVNQTEFETENVTSIALINNDSYNLKEALGMLLHHLNRRAPLLSSLEFLREEYFERLLGFNKIRSYLHIKEERYFKGKIIDVLPSGELVLLNDQLEKESFGLKEVKFLF